MWSTHRSLVLRLPWSSWVAPVEDQVQRWYDCLFCGSPGGARCTGKLAAMGSRDMALVRAFSGIWQPAHESQPRVGFFYCRRQAPPVCGEREVTIVVPPPVCDSAVEPCFHGSPVFLHRHSLLQISSLPSAQSVSPQPTAVLARASSPFPMHQLPAPLTHLRTHVSVRSM